MSIAGFRATRFHETRPKCHLCGCVTTFDLARWVSVTLIRCDGHGEKP